MSPESPATAPAAQLPQPAAQTPGLREPDYGHHRSSKICHLPKALRDQLNLLILDGVPYAQIPKLLGDAAQHITADNVTRWANGSYLLWLAEFNHLQDTRAQQEVAMDLACPEGGSRIHEATLQLAATGITKLVRNLDLSDFQEMLHADPAKFIPFLTALARISDAEIKCERHRLELEARAPAAGQTHSPDKTPGLSTETRRKMEHELNLM